MLILLKIFWQNGGGILVNFIGSMGDLSIYEFARFSFEQKADLIKNKGVFLENLDDGGNEISLYYLQGLFVEVEVNKLQNVIVDITPFRQGYKANKYKDKLIAS